MTHTITSALLVLIITIFTLLQDVQSAQITSDKVPQVVKNAIPKHVKAMYKAHKAIYAKDYAYKLIPIPNKIVPLDSNPSTVVPPASIPNRSNRQSRQAWNSPYPSNPPQRQRRRKKRPAYRMNYNGPVNNGLSGYASKYKSYQPNYKKRRPAPYPPNRVLMTQARYPTKYRMPIHNVIEPMEEYNDADDVMMPEIIDEEPIVMDTMSLGHSLGGHSYSGGAISSYPTSMLSGGFGGGGVSMMRPSQSDEIYMSDYDEMSPSSLGGGRIRMPARHLEYNDDSDILMSSQSDLYSGLGGSELGFGNSLRGRGGSTKLRTIKPIISNNIMYSSRYRDLRNGDSRFEPSEQIITAQHRKPSSMITPLRQISPDYNFGGGGGSSIGGLHYLEQEGLNKYIRNNRKPELDDIMYATDLGNTLKNNNPLRSYSGGLDDSDYLSSNIRIKTELPSSDSLSNFRSANKYHEQDETIHKDEFENLFLRKPSQQKQQQLQHQQPTVAALTSNGNIDNWSGSLKFMPRPFASLDTVTGRSVGNSPSSKIVKKSVQPQQQSSSKETKNNDYDTTNINHYKQPALTIHDLLVQQAKQIQQSTASASSSSSNNNKNSQSNNNRENNHHIREHHSQIRENIQQVREHVPQIREHVPQIREHVSQIREHVPQSREREHNNYVQSRELSNDDDYSNNDFFGDVTGVTSGIGHNIGGDIFKSNAQHHRYTSMNNLVSSRPSEPSPPQYHRYSRPPLEDDMDAVLDSLPWKVKRRKK